MALNIENIVAELKEATILELNDLVQAIEEELYRKYKEFYGYVFFIAKKIEQ